MRSAHPASADLTSAGAVERPFVARVPDDETGRGAPLVEVSTLAHAVWYTDSSGVAAITDPRLFGHDVYFRVRSHGYEFLGRPSPDEDAENERGKLLRVTPGGRAELKIRRNIAERLYCVTGAGICQDSIIGGPHLLYG